MRNLGTSLTVVLQGLADDLATPRGDPLSPAIGVAPPVLFLLCLFNSGCDSLGSPESSFSVRDSLGITIVENHQTPEALTSCLELEPDPLVELGVVSGNADQEFGEFPFARLFGPDQVLVADDHAREARVFDFSGKLLWRFGREGEGPQEFRLFNQVQVTAGDTIRIFDRGNRRITLLAPPSKEFLTIPIMDRQIFQARSLRFTPQGALLLSALKPGDRVQGSSGWILSRDSVSLHLADREGDFVALLGTFLHREMLSLTHREGTVSRGYEGLLPFGRTSEWAVSAEGVFVSTNDALEVKFFDFDGNLKRIIRWSAFPVPLTDEEIQAEKASMIAEYGDSEESPFPIDPLFDRSFLPAFKPAFRGLLHDGAGHLLVGSYQPQLGHNSLWYVFEDTGALLGTFNLPTGAQIRDISGGLVLIQAPHPLNVPVFLVYRLLSPGHP